jgi:hypothetical protein
MTKTRLKKFFGSHPSVSVFFPNPSKHSSYWLPEANSMLSFDWTSFSLIKFLFLFCNVIG